MLDLFLKPQQTRPQPSGGSQSSLGYSEVIELSANTLSRSLGEVIRRHARPAQMSSQRGFGVASIRAMIANSNVNQSSADAMNSMLQKVVQYTDMWYARVFILQRKLGFGQPNIFERRDAILQLPQTRPAAPVPSLKEYISDIQNRVEVQTSK